MRKRGFPGQPTRHSIGARGIEHSGRLLTIPSTKFQYRPTSMADIHVDLPPTTTPMIPTDLLMEANDEISKQYDKFKSYKGKDNDELRKRMAHVTGTVAMYLGKYLQYLTGHTYSVDVSYPRSTKWMAMDTNGQFTSPRGSCYIATIRFQIYNEETKTYSPYKDVLHILTGDLDYNIDRKTLYVLTPDYSVTVGRRLENMPPFGPSLFSFRLDNIFNAMVTETEWLQKNGVNLDEV